MTLPRLFHLVEPDAWAAAARAADGRLRPASLAREGFVHLSTADQLAGTLAAHFGGVARIVLLEVGLPADEPALRFEPARGGEPFPHLYRALCVAEVTRTWELTRGPAGFALPPLADAPHAPADPHGAGQ